MLHVVTMSLNFCHLKMSLFDTFFNFEEEFHHDRVIKAHRNPYYSESKFCKLSFKDKCRGKALNCEVTEFFYIRET